MVTSGTCDSGSILDSGGKRKRSADGQQHWAQNGTDRPFPRRVPALNVALLTPHEGPAGPVARIAHYTKQQYARLHGYRFILDTTPYAANHTRHPTWNRCGRQMVERTALCRDPDFGYHI